MDYRYKKIPIKFTNEEVKRQSRHAETVRARESSRFKRLSMLRSMLDSTEDSISINSKSVQNKEKKEPASRLEMLKKWKEEKRLKKETDKRKVTNKPFYTGSLSVKSRLKKDEAKSICTGKAAAGSSAVFNTNLKASIPRITKNYSKDPVAKSISDNKIKANESNLKTKLQVPTLRPTSIKQPNKPAAKESFLPVFKQHINKPTSMKPPISKPTSMKPPISKPTSMKPPISKPTSMKPPISKPGSIQQPINKSISKTGIPSSSSSKGIPVQKPQSRIGQLSSSSSKLIPVRNSPSQKTPKYVQKVREQKRSNGTEKTSNIKAVDEKKAASNSGALKKAHKTEISEQSSEIGGQALFECNVSVIKPAPSFAPADFKFVTPAGIADFSLGEELQQKIKLIFMSRTSTPSKPCEKSSYDTKDFEDISKESPSIVKNIDFLPKTLDQSSEVHKATTNQPVIQDLLTEEEFIDCSEVDSQNGPNSNLVNDILETNHEKSIEKEYESKECELPKSDVCIDSPLYVDLSKINEVIAKQMEIIKLDDEDLNDDCLSEELDAGMNTRRKPSISRSQRVSIMKKNMLVLNSIAETSECDAQSPAKSLKNKPCSVVKFSSPSISEDNAFSSITDTPRRSQRLMAARKCQNEEESTFYPIEERKVKSGRTPRRSMRLIDLNTPENAMNEAGSCKTNITADFDRLTLKSSTETENMDPDDFLPDFECTPIVSKKISLLYSPQKIRKSMRKSIRGDLISFSPSN